MTLQPIAARMRGSAPRNTASVARATRPLASKRIEARSPKRTARRSTTRPAALARVLEKENAMREPNRILTAQDLMTTTLITFRPKQTILEAISTLTKNGVSGAPVVDDEGSLVGILSELDCLRMLASDEFYQEEQEEGASIEQFMTRDFKTIPPELGIYAISHYFLTTPIRRLPVVDKNRLVGQVSRRDVLKGMEEMSRKRLVRKRYPDYLQPA